MPTDEQVLPYICHSLLYIHSYSLTHTHTHTHTHVIYPHNTTIARECYFWQITKNQYYNHANFLQESLILSKQLNTSLHLLLIAAGTFSYDSQLRACHIIITEIMQLMNCTCTKVMVQRKWLTLLVFKIYYTRRNLVCKHTWYGCVFAKHETTNIPIIGTTNL